MPFNFSSNAASSSSQPRARAVSRKRAYWSDESLAVSALFVLIFDMARIPPDPKLLLDAYVDESSQTQHRYLTLGGLVMPSRSVSTFEEAVVRARIPELPKGEMAWTKVSTSKLPAYKKVVDVFFNTLSIKPLEFHVVAVDTSKINDRKYNEGSRETGFNKEIYQLGRKFGRLYPRSLFHIYLDQRETKSTPENLRFILNCGIRKDGDQRDWPYRRIHFRDSSKSQCIQVVDVLLGGLSFKLNGHRAADNASKSKSALSDYILHRAKIHDITQSTRPSGFFTLWHRNLGG